NSASRQPRGWELREKMKNTHRRSGSGSRPVLPESKSKSSRIRSRSLEPATSYGNVIDAKDDDPSLPPAFREKNFKRSGNRIVTRRCDGTATVSRHKESEQERKARKSNILKSFEKQGLSDSDSRLQYVSPEPLHVLPTVSRQAPTRQSPGSQPEAEDFSVNVSDIESDTSDESDHDDDKSIDLASIIHRAGSKAHKVNDRHHKSNTSGGSFELGRSSHNRSLDLSSHGGYRNKQGDINTSASDDQWARFKLLGRIGLGDIQPSEAARLMIRQNVKVLADIIKQVVALRDEDEDL
ncbi:MAG: hypothetical protein SGILL_009089, partial [Bacillariaceae sp.]